METGSGPNGLMSTQFSRALRDMRIAAQLSQMDVAKRIGVRQSTVSQWELGNLQPVSDSFERLRSVFPAVPVPPEMRDMDKPSGNPSGNPGRRSETARANMAKARRAAAPPVRRHVAEPASGSNGAKPRAKALGKGKGAPEAFLKAIRDVAVCLDLARDALAPWLAPKADG